MYRFFVNEKIGNKFKLSKDILNHMKIIRLKANENFYCNFENKYYLCHLEKNEAIIDEELDINNEFVGDVVLFASIINIKRFEWLVQKATELGVKKIYPMISKNTNKKYVDILSKRIDRLKEISKNASEQSFRNILVEINEPISFNEAIKYDIENKYIAHEIFDNNSENNNKFFEPNVAFYVGPEGGFTEEEITKAMNFNIKKIYLGKRIMRSETASLFFLSRIKDI